MRVKALLSIAAAITVLFVALASWRGDRAHDSSAEAPTSFDSMEAAEPGLRVPSSRVVGRAATDHSAAIARRPSQEEKDALQFSPALVRLALADAIEERLPDLKLSAAELDALADATLRLRRAQQTLRELPEDSSKAKARAEARRHLTEAISDFTYVVEMTPAEFSERVQTDVGIDRARRPDELDEADAEILIRPITAGKALR
jgi:hypothetical protein